MILDQIIKDFLGAPFFMPHSVVMYVYMIVCMCVCMYVPSYLHMGPHFHTHDEYE